MRTFHALSGNLDKLVLKAAERNEEVLEAIQKI
jgi:hypothetical protein